MPRGELRGKGRKGMKGFIEIERITLRIPKSVKNKLEQEAELKGVSLNSLICTILFNYFEVE